MHEDFFVRVNEKTKESEKIERQYTVEVYGPNGISTRPVDMPYLSGQDALGTAEFLSVSVTNNQIEQFGEKLYQTIFGSTEVQSALAHAEQLEKLRLKLAIRPPELSILPWELLRKPQEAYFLGQRESCSIVRFVDSSLPVAQVSECDRLRILYVSAQPKDTMKLDLNRSYNSVKRSIGSAADIVTLNQATPEKLRRALRAGFHVIHFDGHAGFDAATNTSSLLLCDEKKNPVALYGEELADYLDSGNVRLVVLNGCLTGKGSGSDHFAGAAQNIIRTNSIPAVVAMQYKIPDSLAIAFNHGFYRSLVKKEPIDMAVMEGRRAIQDEIRKLDPRSGIHQHSWAIPVLFMRSQDGDIFKSLDERLQDMQVQIREMAEHVEKAKLKDLATGLEALLSNLKVEKRSANQISGFASYRWGEPELTFGRQDDARALLDLLSSHQQNRLVFVTAEDGSDSSEFLRAGVVARLIADGKIALHFQVGDFDPGRMIRSAFLTGIASLSQKDDLFAKPLTEFLGMVSALLPGRRIIIVLDGFESLFLGRGINSQYDFLNEINDCLKDFTLPVQWVMAVCEQKIKQEKLQGIRSFFGGTHTTDFHVCRFTHKQARQFIDGLAWKDGSRVDDARVDEYLGDKGEEGYSPNSIFEDIFNPSSKQFKVVELAVGKSVKSSSSKKKKIIIAAGILVWLTLLVICIATDEGLLIVFLLANLVMLMSAVVAFGVRRGFFQKFMCGIGLHDRGWEYDSQDTCKRVYYCKRDGCPFSKNKIEHEKWSDWLYTKEKSCIQESVCLRCGGKKKRVVHEKWSGWRYVEEKKCDQEYVCLRCGDKAHPNRIEHEKWSGWAYRTPGSCIQTRICLRCGFEKDRREVHAASGIYYVREGECFRENICRRCGHHISAGIQHKLVAGPYVLPAMNNCQVIYTCIRCGFKVIGEIHVWQDPIPNEPGSRSGRHTCKRCGKTEYVSW